jgi:DNA-binding transcriptional ArsR family regulator
MHMESYQARAATLKAIAHPVRLHIVDILRQAPECVCHLSAALTKPQPYISQQLAILRQCLLPAGRRGRGEPGGGRVRPAGG